MWNKLQAKLRWLKQNHQIKIKHSNANKCKKLNLGKQKPCLLRKTEFIYVNEQQCWKRKKKDCANQQSDMPHPHPPSEKQFSKSLCKFVSSLLQIASVGSDFNLNGQVGMQSIHTSSLVGGYSITKNTMISLLMQNSVYFLLHWAKKLVFYLQPILGLQWIGYFIVQPVKVLKEGDMNLPCLFYQPAQRSRLIWALSNQSVGFGLGKK